MDEEGEQKIYLVHIRSVEQRRVTQTRAEKGSVSCRGKTQRDTSERMSVAGALLPGGPWGPQPEQLQGSRGGRRRTTVPRNCSGPDGDRGAQDRRLGLRQRPVAFPPACLPSHLCLLSGLPEARADGCLSVLHSAADFQVRVQCSLQVVFTKL